MSERIYPYKTITGDLRLDVKDLKVDGTDPSPDPLNRDNLQINLFDQERASWATLGLKLELQGPAEELRKFGDDITALAVVHCDLTHERRAVPMKRAGVDAARWTAVLEIERDDYRGSAKLEAVVSGPAGGLDNRFLGISAPWVLNCDEPPVSPRTGAIDVKWVDFKAQGAPEFLKHYVNEPFYSNLADEKPVVYLNKCKEFERLPIILDDRPRQRGDLPLHNAERTGIARSVWMAMLNAAIAGIQEGEDGADPDWPESDWQSKVLKVLLPKIYRNQSDAEALKSAFDAWESRQGAGLLESRGQAEINRRIGAAKLLRRTLDLLSASQEGAS